VIDRLGQSPLLTRNQMPPPPPVTYSRYHLDGWDWGSVARVVVFTPRNESDYTRAGQEFQDALASELQRLGRFEVVAAPADDHARLASFAHQGGAFDEGVAVDIATRTRADVLVLPTITQYSPYPRPRMGVVVQAVAPFAGKVAASVDGLWDTTDGGIAEQVRAYYRQRPKPLPAYVRNHTIVADDNFAADIALDSPALFQRFVANTVARLLVDPAWSPAGLAKPAANPAPGGTAADGCDPNCRPRPLSALRRH
jgi:hypothetical protein